MFKKIIALTCLLAFLGCETDQNDDPDYTFSANATVASISDPVASDNDWAKITTREGEYVVMVTSGVHLQRLKSDNTGYVDIDSSLYTIITPGDRLQFAWVDGQIDYACKPPVVRADTIIVMK